MNGGLAAHEARTIAMRAVLPPSTPPGHFTSIVVSEIEGATVIDKGVALESATSTVLVETPAHRSVVTHQIAVAPSLDEAVVLRLHHEAGAPVTSLALHADAVLARAGIRRIAADVMIDSPWAAILGWPDIDANLVGSALTSLRKAIESHPMHRDELATVVVESIARVSRLRCGPEQARWLAGDDDASYTPLERACRRVFGLTPPGRIGELSVVRPLLIAGGFQFRACRDVTALERRLRPYQPGLDR